MTRRDLMQQAARLAAAYVGTQLPIATWAAMPASGAADTEIERLLDQIGDTILPATPGSPGAGEVGIGRFVLYLTAECHPPETAATLHEALAGIRRQASRRFSRDWSTLATGEREVLLADYEREALAATPERKTGWLHLKGLILLGYFTSEAGATRALRYDPVPGAYRGVVPLLPGDRSWAP
ncbi:MAG: gluconate 2-dehydrogenase subunit 3 family protein [Verrucomicrobia bacterium]|nr:gluconate 2-dehydrogenase subunit 3 family protein [Verrucomicrobiota bacterium]